MNIMRDVYNTLKDSQYFIDNEYLLKYCKLVEMYSGRRSSGKFINKHHIIPKCWYKLTGNEINNCLNNLVYLPYREHVLAHYYLCLCTQDPLQFGNQLALICLISRSSKLNTVDKQLLEHLPLYNNIYENYKYKRKSNYKLWDN
jgi:hypothetical protein